MRALVRHDTCDQRVSAPRARTRATWRAEARPYPWGTDSGHVTHREVCAPGTQILCYFYNFGEPMVKFAIETINSINLAKKKNLVGEIPTPRQVARWLRSSQPSDNKQVPTWASFANLRSCRATSKERRPSSIAFAHSVARHHAQLQCCSEIKRQRVCNSGDCYTSSVQDRRLARLHCYLRRAAAAPLHPRDVRKKPHSRGCLSPDSRPKLSGAPACRVHGP